MNHPSEPRISPWAKGATENYDAFLSHLGQKTLAAVEKHSELAENDAAQGYGKSWKRLAGMLGQLAPWAIEAVGRQSLKFHIPDGKYRQQVFALENATPGTIRVYLPDVLQSALQQRILTPASPDTHTFLPPDSSTPLHLDILTSDTQDAPAFCKPMLGWGRKALRITLSAVADESHLRAVERLCELAAHSWKDKALPETPVAK